MKKGDAVYCARLNEIGTVYYADDLEALAVFKDESEYTARLDQFKVLSDDENPLKWEVGDKVACEGFNEREWRVKSIGEVIRLDTDFYCRHLKPGCAVFAGFKRITRLAPAVDTYIRFIRDSKSGRYKKGEVAKVVDHGPKSIVVKRFGPGIGCNSSKALEREPALFLPPNRSDIYTEVKPVKLSSLEVLDPFIPIENRSPSFSWVYGGTNKEGYGAICVELRHAVCVPDINVLPV